MEIYQVGSHVMIKKMIIDGIVKSVLISDNNSVLYTVGWWADVIYNTNTFLESEVYGKVEDRITIGFKQ